MGEPGSATSSVLLHKSELPTWMCHCGGTLPKHIQLLGESLTTRGGVSCYLVMHTCPVCRRGTTCWSSWSQAGQLALTCLILTLVPKMGTGSACSLVSCTFEA